MDPFLLPKYLAFVWRMWVRWIGRRRLLELTGISAFIVAVLVACDTLHG